MTIRQAAKSVAISSAVFACAGAASILGGVGIAGAGTGVGASGNTVPGVVGLVNPDPTSGEAPTPNTPFSSGQTITVSVPANSVLTPGAGLAIEECAAPGGVPPSAPTGNCDGNTHQGPTVTVQADGSASLPIGQGGYQLFALPDQNFGESAGQTPVCDLTHECVLYIGQDQNNFTAPHFFSTGFYINPNLDGSGNQQDNAANPGDGLPEAPLAIGLPAAALGLVGGTVLVRRRRNNRNSAAA